METLRFFSPDGKRLLTKEEFISFYSQAYFLNGKTAVKNVFRSSKWVEDNIEEILKQGIKSHNDVIRILAWKTGKIKHAESEKNKKFIYSSDWINAERFDIMRYGDRIDPTSVKSFVEFICSNVDEFKSLIDKGEHQRLLNLLSGKSYKGIGTVYMITLIYFLSAGELPIYDKFAQISVDAILKGKKPGEAVRFKELPVKATAEFSTVMDNGNAYKNYIESLNIIFGDEYKTNRDIDRALWVYGHLFVSNGKC